MDWRRLAVFVLAGTLGITAVSCGKKETKPMQEQSHQNTDEIKPASKQAYEECPEAIDYFCKTMGVKKQELNLIFNFKSMYGNYSYDVGVTGKPELTGTYIFTDTYAYTEDPVGERWYIAKKVTAREKKERNLEEKLGDWCNDYLYEEICPEETEKDSAAVKLSIDESTVKKYKEKRFGTDAIWECWSGEIDKNDRFSVSYYGDTSGWKTGYFDGKKWKIQQHVAVGDEQYYHYDTAAGLLWNFDGKRLTVGDQTGKTVYNFTMSEWRKKNELEEDPACDRCNIMPLTKTKAVFHCNLSEKDKVMSYIVDLRTLKVEKSFDRALYGSYYGGDFYNFDINKKTLEIVDLRTGETKEKVDYSAILEGVVETGIYLNYNEEMQGFVEADDNMGDESIRYCVNPNTGEVYFSYFNGVFHYNQETKKLEKIVDSKNLKLFPEMCGTMEVGADGKIYMLGFLGGGDDEGPIDFLYMTPEEKE